jgi:hypothetical protein
LQAVIAPAMRAQRGASWLPGEAMRACEAGISACARWRKMPAAARLFKRCCDDPRPGAPSRRIQLALAHASSKDKEKFVLPLKEYRRALDLVLTVAATGCLNAPGEA